MAIEQALTILSWMEHLTKDERPPEYLWEDPEGLNEWWARVEGRREARYSSAGGAGTEGGDADQGQDMAENEIAKQLKR